MPSNTQRSFTNKSIELVIDNLSSDGSGVARIGRDVYFVPGALPGERVLARLKQRRKKIIYTQLLEVLDVSPNRVEPDCVHYQTCGGCSMQQLAYAEQVRLKEERVKREFQRKKINLVDWQPSIVGEAWHYRRKARLGVRYSKERDQVYIGFHESESSHITDINQCLVLPENPLLDFNLWRELIGSLDARSLITQIETLWVDNALAFVLRTLKPLTQNDLDKLKAAFIENQKIDEELELQLWLRTEKGAVAEPVWPENAQVLKHSVNGLTLEMKPEHFIQVNKMVNQKMVVQAIDWLSPASHEVVWDLFAGHGNFSMPLAQLSANVIAVEVHEGMIESLRQQSEQLALPLQALQADLSGEESLAGLPVPDAVLLDPPRAGAWQVIEQLNKMKVKRVLYISCDAATLSRDLSSLCASGYEVVKAGIIDMFPQTHHVETMVLLEFRGK